MLRKAVFCIFGAIAVVPGAASAVDAQVEGGVNATAQGAEGAHADALSSVDILITAPGTDGTWSVYIEGSTAPDEGGVAAVYGEANADAGTALTGEGEGNFQVSEFKYRHETGAVALTAGVLDTTAYMDFSFSANDENAQFLGATLVNNPTIEFPDYSLGLVIEKALDDAGSQLFALVTSSHGLADNPSVSYAELFDVGGTGKGAFIAAGARWAAPQRSLEIGAWGQTTSHDRLDGGDESEANWGMYLVLGRSREEYAADLRLGFANPNVAEAASFISVSCQKAWEPWTVGVGLARVFLSDEAENAGRGDVTQGELYARYALNPHLAVTLDAQYLQNSGFDENLGDVGVAGARVRYEF